MRQMAELGRLEWAYVLYAVAGPPLWHQRLVLGRVALSASDVIGLTPDGELYVDDYGEGNADIAAVRYGSYAEPPLGIPRLQCYRFRAEPTEAEVRRLRAEAELLAQEECRRRAASLGRPGLLVGLRVLVPVLAPATAVAQPARPSVGLLRGQAAPAAIAQPEGAWRAAMSQGSVRYGDIMGDHVRTASAVGERDLHDLGGGVAIFVEFVAPAAEGEFFDRAVEGDARVLALRRNRQGRREITWREMAERVSREEFPNDWSLPGPRTSLWCIEHIDAQGGNLETHHDRFRTICKLQATDWGVQEHYQTCLHLKHALLVDQVDGTNLQSIEGMFRRLQTIEYAHGDTAREADARALGGKMSLEEQSIFAGTTRSHSSVMVCPELLSYVREEVEREAKLSKALRLAREERDEKRKSKSKKGKGKGDDE